MFTRFIELVLGLFVALYLLIDRFGIAGCVRAMRRADPHLLLAVSGAVVFLLMVLAAQTCARWRKERDRKRKEQQRSAQRRQKAAEQAAPPAAATTTPAPTATATPAPTTATTPPATDTPTPNSPDAEDAGPRFLRRRPIPDLLDGLMPDSADEDDDLVQVIAADPVVAPAAGDDYVI